MFKIGCNSEKSNSKTLGSTLALLKTGQSGPEVTPSTNSFTFCLASSIVIFSSNSISITEKSSEDVERISTKFGTPFRASSKGSVIIRSISSAVFPGYTALTKTLVSLISGKASLGIVKYDEIPKMKNRVIITYMTVLCSIAQEENKNSLILGVFFCSIIILKFF